jgi:hypothetical protein
MELPSIGAGELASQIRSEYGNGTWMCVVAPEERLVTITNEIEHALLVGNSKSVIIQLNRSVKPLVDAPHDVLVLVGGFNTLSDDEWQHLDQLRSTRLIRNQPALLMMSPASMQHLMRLAPNMASIVGGQFFHFQEHAERLTDEERTYRLADLRFHFDKTDDDIIEMARTGAPMDEPAYAEWLVLLNRGDLLQR